MNKDRAIVNEETEGSAVYYAAENKLRSAHAGFYIPAGILLLRDTWENANALSNMYANYGVQRVHRDVNDFWQLFNLSPLQ